MNWLECVVERFLTTDEETKRRLEWFRDEIMKALEDKDYEKLKFLTHYLDA